MEIILSPSSEDLKDQALIVTALGDLPSSIDYDKFKTLDQLNHWTSCKLFYLILALEFQSYFQGKQSVIPSMVSNQLQESEAYIIWSISQKTFSIQISETDANCIEVNVKRMLDLYQVIRLGWQFIKEASTKTDSVETRIILKATSPGELFTKILTIECENFLSVCQGYTEINVREFCNILYAFDKLKRELRLASKIDKSTLLKLKNLEARVRKLQINFKFKSDDLLNFCVTASAKARSNRRKDALNLAIQAYQQSSDTLNALIKSAGHPRKGRKTQIWDNDVLRSS